MPRRSRNTRKPGEPRRHPTRSAPPRAPGPRQSRGPAGLDRHARPGGRPPRFPGRQGGR
ncbi:MAG: hypothetical protein HLUCCA08_06195 [Rhodobacteraceae bacterium HLUCCA08]|nr:MAG: hypothetical protein HLUCCA08_06195 [Rhodobacteraceae bacterium HLUCCA08]